jgi:hypothetical protein
VHSRSRLDAARDADESLSDYASKLWRPDEQDWVRRFTADAYEALRLANLYIRKNNLPSLLISGTMGVQEPPRWTVALFPLCGGPITQVQETLALAVCRVIRRHILQGSE